MTLAKVLIANRGEIAVRVARACRDAGLASVAVYADPDRDAPHVRAADEAFALGGDTPAASYLDIGKILAAAAKSGADAVHPGYGFLSENADFAQAVLDAGLTWIGPPPQAIRDLGDKVAARKIAQRAGAPLVAGTADPVSGAAEVTAFAEAHGLPVAIKAAFGGGGRGLKVARTLDEIPELYESAVREAVAAFGRGECFVERYLDRPRHVETQCLADAHGTVIVVSTRDCSLQRRHQKLVEEAPAPYLTEEQDATLRAASKAILREAGYIGAGTCEFLIGQDGTISFLEVNTRLQVEHPVTEEVTGIDLVREMFRIADGEPLGPGPTAPGRPRRARPLDRVPDQRRGPRPRLPARARHRHHLAAARRARRPAGRRRRGRLGDRPRLGLAARQAHRHRRHPRAGTAARRQGPGRIRGRRARHRPAVPPGRRHRPRLRPRTAREPRAVHRAHPVDRDRIPQRPPALERRRRRDRRNNRAPDRQTVIVEVDGKRLEVTLPATWGRGAAAAPTRSGQPRRQRGRGQQADALLGTL